MRKRYIIVILFLIILNLTCVVNANTLTLDLKTSANTISIDDEVIITVNWKEKMQAADFILEYDSQKLEFIESDIDENFTNTKDNQLLVSWFSNNNEDKTNMNFKFKAISEGGAEFVAKVSGGFATGNLEVPNNYEEGNLEIQIKESNLLIKIFLLIFVIIMFLILIKYKKTRGRNK